MRQEPNFQSSSPLSNSKITPELITNLFLYGTENTPLDLNDRIRTSQSSQNIKLFADSESYMKDGPGRFIRLSDFNAIDEFFTSSLLSNLPDARTELTREELSKALSLSDSDFKTDTILQYNFRPESADYNSRVYIWNSTAFAIDARIDPKFIVEKTGSGTIRSIEGIRILPFDDNFDLDSDNVFTQIVNSVLLSSKIDPQDLGRTVSIEFTEQSKLNSPVISSYNGVNYNNDVINSLADRNGGIFSSRSVNSLIDDLESSHILEYERDGKPIIFGTFEGDTISENSETIYVLADGNDIATAGDGKDIILGGDGDDILTGGGGNDIINGGNDNDTAIFSGTCLEYDIDKQDDGTVIISHLRGDMTDGVDTLSNVEIARFSDGKEIDLTQDVLFGCTEISFTTDFVTGLTGDTQIVFQLERAGDVSYEIDVFVDGTITLGNNVFFTDYFDVIDSNESPVLTVPNRTQGGDDFAYRIDLSIADSNPAKDFISFKESSARALLLGDGVDDRGGRTFGDPHLITFDNVSYDFQASGEFVLTRATEGDPYEVQVRFNAISSAVSVTEAVATRVGATTVSVEATGGGGTILVDGSVLELGEGETFTVGDGTIARSGRQITIDHGNGDVTNVDVFSTFLNVTPSPSLDRPLGTLEGLLGNGDRNPSDDFQLDDGTILNTPLPTELLYGDFAASWLLSEENSILPGVREEFEAPGRVITIDSLPETLRLAAEAAVDELGITNPILREAAILDFALTGDEEFIEAASITDDIFNPIVDTIAVDPVVNPVLLLTTDTSSLSEEDTDNNEAIITVSRGSSVGDLVINYSTSGVGENPADLDDFTEDNLTGTVTILDGEDQATFTIAVAEDEVQEGDETFNVAIEVEESQRDDYEILVSSLNFTITDTDTDIDVPNVAPTVENDARTVNFETSILVDVLANDSDSDGTLDAASLSVASDPSNGTATIENGQIRYNPVAGFNGSDSFTYTIEDDEGAISSEATVTMTVMSDEVDPDPDPIPVNEAPIAAADNAATDYETATLIDVLSNDRDPDGTLQLSSIVITQAPSNGSAVVTNDNKVRYTPASGFSGTSSFAYTVLDNEGVASNAALVTVAVGDDPTTEVPNLPPVANGEAVSASYETSILIDALANDSDPDGTIDPALLTITQAPVNGVAVVEDGQILYTPNDDFNGEEVLSYTAGDNEGRSSNVANVSITVQAPVTETGTERDDRFVFSELEDTDIIDGQAGFDTIVISGKIGDASFTPIEGGFRFEQEGRDSVDLLGIEQLEFDDGTLRNVSDDKASALYQIYQTYFDRAPEYDGAGFWYDLASSEALSLREIGSFFFASDEYRNRELDQLSDEEFVSDVYSTAFEREADTAGHEFWSGLVSDEQISRAELLYQFALSNEAASVFENQTDDGVLIAI